MTQYSTLHGYNLDGSDAGITLTSFGPLSQDVIDHLSQATPMTPVALDIAPVFAADAFTLQAVGPITPEMLANLVFVDPSSLSAAPIAGADLKALVTTGLISVGPITPEMLANVVPGEATALGPVTPIAGDHFTVAQIALEAAGPISPEALANVVPVSPTELSSFEIHIVGVNAGHTAAFQ